MSEPVPTPTPAEKPADLVSEYELPTSAYEPELDDTFPESKTAPQAATAPPATPEPATPPRNPDGTFAKKPHSQHLIRLATQLGMTEAEINDTPSAELREAVRDMQMEALLRQSQNNTASNAVRQDVPAPPAPEEEYQLDEGQYDPGLVKAHKYLVGELAQVKAQLAQIRDYHIQQQNQTIGEQIDGTFERLNIPALGKGKRHDFKQDSPEYRRRVAVLEEANRIEHGSMAEKIEKAAKTLFGESKPAEPVSTSASTELSQRSPTQEAWINGTVAKPTQRAPAKMPHGVQRAYKTIGEKFREKNLTEDSFDGIEEAGLPE